MTARLDVKYRPLLTGKSFLATQQPARASSVHLGEFVILGEGVRLGEGVIIDHHVVIEQDVTIGAKSLFCYRAQVCAQARIGSDCVIGGFIGERSVIGDGARVFGSLVHKHPRHVGGWDDDAEEADGPRIGDGVFVGFGAVIVGNISIGAKAYIGANAVVCSDVTSGAKIAPCSLWQDSASPRHD